MAYDFDALQGLQLVLGRGSLVPHAAQIAVDEFNSLEQTAGRFALPHFTVTTLADELDETIAGNGLLIGQAREACRLGRCGQPFGRSVNVISIRVWRKVVRHSKTALAADASQTNARGNGGSPARSPELYPRLGHTCELV